MDIEAKYCTAPCYEAKAARSESREEGRPLRAFGEAEKYRLVCDDGVQ